MSRIPVTRRLLQVDAETLEPVEGFTVIAVQQRSKIKEAFVLLFQKGLERLAVDNTLRGESLRVLMALLGTLNYENHIHVSHTDVAKSMGLSRSSVSRAIAQLVERGVLELGPKLGNVNTYRLDDTLGWKGRVRSLQESRSKRLALVKSMDDQVEHREPRS